MPLYHNVQFSSSNLQSSRGVILKNSEADMRSMHMPSLMVQALNVQIDSIIS